MTLHTVTVSLRIRAESRHAFRNAVLDNAETSLRLEHGCRRFDVCVDTNGSKFFLYELYDTLAAFQAHLATPHFLRFDALTKPWIEEKTVETYTLLREGTAGPSDAAS